MTDTASIHYFAYGSNMDIGQMQSRCPGAQLLGAAELAEHRFGINARGYATVIPHPGQTVHGLVWAISQSHSLSLDRHESVPHHYVRQTLAISAADGLLRDMLIYVAVNASPGAPRPGYLEKILAAARHHHLPEPYVQSLAAWQR
jgi:gamma-glutamylcyclotransferase (GGCT)/AIG2-like uncharacterized protein YtfP